MIPVCLCSLICDPRGSCVCVDVQAVDAPSDTTERLFHKTSASLRRRNVKEVTSRARAPQRDAVRAAAVTSMCCVIVFTLSVNDQHTPALFIDTMRRSDEPQQNKSFKHLVQASDFFFFPSTHTVLN